METRCDDPDCKHPNCNCWETQRRFSQARVIKLEKSLEFLLEVRRHKNEYGKDQWYMDAQPIAWEQAADALGIKK